MKILPCLMIVVASLMSCESIRAQTSSRADHQLRLYGNVTDADGKPIQGAMVRVLVSRTVRDFDQQSLGFVSTLSNQAGELHLRWATNDPRYILCCGKNAIILVSAPGYESSIEALNLRRFAVDAPVHFELVKAMSLSVLVRDASGKPLVNAMVRPAAIGDAKLCYAEVGDFEHSTNAEGIAVFNSLPSSGLQQIFVVHPDIGSQCIQTSTSATGLEATALATRSVKGKVTIKRKEGYKVPKLETIKLRFTVSNDESMKALTWAECDVAPNGEFAIRHLSTGRVDFRSDLPREMPYTFDYFGLANKLTTNFEAAELELVPATRVDGQILDEDTEQGVANIFIDHFDLEGRPTLTDPEGRFFFWVPASVSFSSNGRKMQTHGHFVNWLAIGRLFFDGQTASCPANE